VKDVKHLFQVHRIINIVLEKIKTFLEKKYIGENILHTLHTFTLLFTYFSINKKETNKVRKWRT
jgi:hypothetical protein